MRTIHIGDRELSVQGSPWALVLYRREFSTDEKRADWHRDFQQAYGDFSENNTRVDQVFLLQTAWAMAKNADDSTPPFDEWVKSLADVPMTMTAPWVWEVHRAIFAELFRIGGDTEEVGE